MKADVQISRVHKGSPYNVQAVLFDIMGDNEEDILNNIEVQKSIDETFGRELRISVLPIEKSSHTDFYITKENKKSMKEIIKITDNNGKRAVSAREIYDFLEIKEGFNRWIERMFEYKFVKNIDYQPINIFVHAQNGIGGTNKKDYALTIDTAKEIAMIQRTPKGKEARQYFIQMERVALDKLLREIPTKAQIGRVEHENSVVAKKVELMNIIKYYLKRGDLKQIAKDLNLSYKYVRTVSCIDENRKSKTVVNAMYQKAMQNKNELLFTYDEMINELKK